MLQQEHEQIKETFVHCSEWLSSLLKSPEQLLECQRLALSRVFSLVPLHYLNLFWYIHLWLFIDFSRFGISPVYACICLCNSPSCLHICLMYLFSLVPTTAIYKAGIILHNANFFWLLSCACLALHFSSKVTAGILSYSSMLL